MLDDGIEALVARTPAEPLARQPRIRDQPCGILDQQIVRLPAAVATDAAAGFQRRQEFVTEKRLVWGDAQGSRVYSVEKSADGTNFSMTERIGGPLFPLFAGMIPPFDESFNKFSADLKKEAETIQKKK